MSFFRQNNPRLLISRLAGRYKDKNMKKTLRNPERYKGHWTHPINDKSTYQVIGATITPTFPGAWHLLEIQFEGGKKFMKASPSERGAKQIFAYQCSGGSKWDYSS